MDITISVPDEKIRATIADYARDLFATPAYRGQSGGIGWQAVYQCAREQVAAIDWVPLVQAAIRANLSEVIAQAVMAELKRQATTQAKLLMTEAKT